MDVGHVDGNRKVLRLPRQKPKHNRRVKSECHGSHSVMGGNAFANGLHVVRKALFDLDAAEPRRRPSLSRGTAARSRRLRLVAKPLRIQHERNGTDRAALLCRTRLYPAIHRIGYVQCRSHGKDYTKSSCRSAIWIYAFMHTNLPLPVIQDPFEANCDYTIS